MVSVSEKVSILRSAFGPVELGRDKINANVKCPKCAKPGSNKKKLVIRLDDGRFHCWVCGIKGRSLGILYKKYAPSKIDDVKKITGKSAKNIFNEKEEEVEVEEKLKIPNGFKLLGPLIGKARDPDVRAALSYCKMRGLSARDLWHYRMGTCTSGRFRRRVIIPSFDDEGNLNYYSGRSIDDSNGMKYVNASVPKITVVFNGININWSKELALVEGPFDLVKCNMNATCLLGSHLSGDSLLFRKIAIHQTPIVIALDPDARKKSHEIAKMLSSYGVSVRMAKIPENKDVGDMTRKEFTSIRNAAQSWFVEDRLYNLISGIRSGTVI